MKILEKNRSRNAIGSLVRVWNRAQAQTAQGGVFLVRIHRATYREACREGWAPPPTNDLQRAIWEETRKLPEKPIKIEFDPPRGSEDSKRTTARRGHMPERKQAAPGWARPVRILRGVPIFPSSNRTRS